MNKRVNEVDEAYCDPKNIKFKIFLDTALAKYISLDKIKSTKTLISTTIISNKKIITKIFASTQNFTIS